MKLATFAFTLFVATAGALLAGRVSDDFLLAMVVTGAWFAVLTGILVVLFRRRSPLLAPVGSGLAVVVIGITVLIGIPTVFGTSVDETVVVGEPAAAAGGQPRNVERYAGRFVSVAHDGRGRAAVVELPDGTRKLTITSFETDSGPDLRVYLSTSDPANGPLGEFVDLGGLKGNRGDQQYDIPAGVDLERYGAAVVWCRAFSVPFTSAALTAQQL